jgi:hypothetical protein
VSDTPLQPTNEASDALFARLDEVGVLANVHPIEPAATAWHLEREIVATAEGTLTLCDREVQVHVGLPADFPRRLPVIAVDRKGDLGRLPHVESDGTVCYQPTEEPLLDHRNPLGIVSEAIMLAAGTLNDALRGARAEEYANEIAAYWNKAFPEAQCVVSVLDPTDEPRLVTAFSHKGDRTTVADDPAAFASFRIGRNVQRLSFANALYVPIDPATIDPHFHPRDLATPDGVRAFVKPVLRRDKDLWHRILRRCQGLEVVVVLGVRRPAGRRGLVGLLFKREGSVHALDPDRLDARRILPVRIKPADRGFLVPRGGADPGLASRRVLLIGCGAVGGHVAMNLVRAGLGEIDLMDRDTFEYANTFRHVCGRAHVGRPKVEGLRLEIERLWPFVVVKEHHADALRWLREHPGGFCDYDLVISALGNPTIEQRINEVIHRGPSSPPAVFAWLEPLGIGGHVLVTHGGSASPGCFECLYHRTGDPEALVCRTAFATPGGQYTHDVMGCGSQYMTFGDLDAQKTASQVARWAIELLRGGMVENSLLSWKGPVDAFAAAGFTTTPRYDLVAGEESLRGAEFARFDCPICRSV